MDTYGVIYIYRASSICVLFITGVNCIEGNCLIVTFRYGGSRACREGEVEPCIQTENILFQ